MTALHSLKTLLFIFILLPFFSVAQLQFAKNKGQWNTKVQYKADLKAGAFFLEKNGYTIVQHNAEELEKLSGHFHGNESLTKTNTPGRLHSHAVKVTFAGMSANVDCTTRQSNRQL